MAILKTKAIVLKSHKWSESSRIVTLLSGDFGKIRVIAKGARRPKSGLERPLQPLTLSSIIFYKKENRNLHILSQADPINHFLDVKSNLKKLTYASALCELSDRMTTYEQPDRALYETLIDGLRKIEDMPDHQTEKLFWYFKLKIFKILGYSPSFSRCSRCGIHPRTPLLSFSPGLGGILCNGCSYEDPKAPSIHLGTVRFLGRLTKMGPEGLGNVEISELVKGEIREVLTSFLKYHAGNHGRLRSLELLNTWPQEVR
ncbi:MAG TPA: DNA repair protein RecO [Candidatus Latescibacteria bacterium]|nr:DNA repair protein RecO [Candidatus Latescibacterota bacterium]